MSGDFSRRSWASRSKRLGDTAENVFERVEVDANGDPTWERKGLNRPPFDVRELPAKTRYEPDYLQARGRVEVVAMGNDGVLKLKVEKVQALSLWNYEIPTHLWVWDGGRRRNQYGCCTFDALFVELALNAKGDRFVDDDKPYWGIRRLDLPIETWTKFTGELV